MSSEATYTAEGLVARLQETTHYALGLRAKARGTIAGCVDVVIVALDSARLFAIQAHKLTNNTQPQPEDRTHGT